MIPILMSILTILVMSIAIGGVAALITKKTEYVTVPLEVSLVICGAGGILAIIYGIVHFWAGVFGVPLPPQ